MAKTYPISHRLLNQAIRTLHNAIPRRNEGCPVCGSERFRPCYQGCEAADAVELVKELRALKKAKVSNA
ncbi:MAG: hypothetical protein AAFV53_00425 [Myxococcota bacterium]